MTKQLILLSGLHKTGTSSVQQACAKNLLLIKKQGIFYPSQLRNDGALTFDQSGNHTRLLRTVFKEKPKSIYNYTPEYESLRQSVATGFAAQLERGGEDKVLMISEAVSTMTRDELAEMKNWFNRRGFEVRVICLIRKPLSWLNSMVSQRVIGTGGPRLSLKVAIDNFVSTREIIRPRIMNLTRIFPDAEFYSFESAKSHVSGVVGFVLDRIGIEAGEAFNLVKANEGKSDHAVRLNSLINQAIGDRYKLRKANLTYCALFENMPALMLVPGNKFELRHDEAIPLMPFLVDENEWLKSQFGEGFYDDEIKFSAEPVLLDDRTIAFLIENLDSAGPKIKSIVNSYISDHVKNFKAWTL